MSGSLCGTARGAFVVAHRGASAEAPENTLPAFERAIERGCTVLECDVHASADGVVVVMHDPTLRRTTTGAGAIAAQSWSRIGTVDAGYRRRFGDRFRGTTVPRLEQLLELARGRAEVMVEIKEQGEATGIEATVLRAAASMGMRDAVGIISMSAAVVRRVRSLSPPTITGLVLRRRRRSGHLATTIATGADFLIAPTATLLRRPGLCEQARHRGLRLGAYVVESPPQACRLLACGVESLACDDPAAILATVAGRAA